MFFSFQWFSSASSLSGANDNTAIDTSIFSNGAFNIDVDLTPGDSNGFFDYDMNRTWAFDYFSVTSPWIFFPIWLLIIY